MRITIISPELLEQILTDKFQKLFWSKVKIAGPDECWDWQASFNTGGYGQMGVRRFGFQFMLRAHQIAWTSANKRTIPEGLFMLHSCIGNRKCCNPAHLRPGTQVENMQDMQRQGRRTNRKGENSATVKLTTEQVLQLRADHAAGAKYAELMAKFNISSTRIWEITSRRAWNHI